MFVTPVTCLRVFIKESLYQKTRETLKAEDTKIAACHDSNVDMNFPRFVWPRMNWSLKLLQLSARRANAFLRRQPANFET